MEATRRGTNRIGVRRSQIFQAFLARIRELNPSVRHDRSPALGRVSNRERRVRCSSYRRNFVACIRHPEIRYSAAYALVRLDVNTGTSRERQKPLISDTISRNFSCEFAICRASSVCFDLSRTLGVCISKEKNARQLHGLRGYSE